MEGLKQELSKLQAHNFELEKENRIMINELKEQEDQI